MLRETHTPSHGSAQADTHAREARFREGQRTAGRRCRDVGGACHPGRQGRPVPLHAGDGRAFLLAHLKDLLGADPPGFERTTLHCRGTRVEAEVFLPPGFARETELLTMKRRVESALSTDPWFDVIRLNQMIAPN